MIPFQNTQSLFKEFICCFHVIIFPYIVIRHEHVTHLSMCLLPTTTLLVSNNKASVFPFTIQVFPTAKPMRFINADQKLILILLRYCHLWESHIPMMW